MRVTLTVTSVRSWETNARKIFEHLAKDQNVRSYQFQESSSRNRLDKEVLRGHHILLVSICNRTITSSVPNDSDGTHIHTTGDNVTPVHKLMAVSPCLLCTTALVAKEAVANSKTSGREGVEGLGSERQTTRNKTAQLMNPTLPTSHWRPDHAPPREDNSSVRGQCSFHQWCKRTAPYPRGLPIHGQGTGTPCLQEVPMWQCLGSGFSKKKSLGSAAVLATWPTNAFPFSPTKWQALSK